MNFDVLDNCFSFEHSADRLKAIFFACREDGTSMLSFGSALDILRLPLWGC